MSDFSVFLLDKDSQDRFAEADEVFADVQLGQFGPGQDRTLCLVVGGLVGIEIEPNLPDHLNRFYERTWGTYRKQGGDIVAYYNAWLQGLTIRPQIYHAPASRGGLQQFVATGSPPTIPPPPPIRPVIPGGPRPPGTAAVPGHLPFQDVTTAWDIYYRFEAWPTSRRIDLVNRTIAPSTFASPSSELPFLPTGFAAVARNALPSLFPAVFRYELGPVAGATLLCGAVVPMFGMSGGGVEVMFIDAPHTANRGAIANPAVVLPL
jgi:hypothetical protein